MSESVKGMHEATRLCPRQRARYSLVFLAGICLLAVSGFGQENYAIEVYGAETLSRGENEVALHSNYTFDGVGYPSEQADRSEHSLHETVELTHGFTDWFETGLYTLTSSKSAYGFQYVGNHIRPRVRVPERWHWPVGISLALEVGYQRPRFAPDSWTLELAPIVDQHVGPWYLAFNPTFDRSLHGLNSGNGFEFSPNFKVNRSICRLARAGIEYYSGYGPLGDFDPLTRQQHQLFPTLDLELPGKWEVNFGYGIGLTDGASEQMLKLIISRHFGGRHFGGKGQGKD